MANFLISPQTRAHYAPSPDALNISMDFNAAASGTARGTEVIIPDNASPEVRAAAERYNRLVADFARANGIADYPVRGVRTRSENGRGVSHTIHTEPFFNSDTAMQEAIRNNPEAFAAIYRDAFSGIPGARLIAPHGVGKDRGAASPIFGDETTYGEWIANTALGNPYELPQGLPAASPPGTPRTAPQGAPQSASVASTAGTASTGGNSDLLALIDQRSRPSEHAPAAEPTRAERLTERMGTMNALSQFMPKAQTQDVNNFLVQPQQPQQSVGFGPGTNPFLVG